MNSKSFELLFFLLHSLDGLEITDLIAQFKLSDRRVYSLIEEIKFFLQSEDYGRIQKKGNRYYVVLQSQDKIKEILCDREVIRNLSLLRRVEILIIIVSRGKMVTVRDLENILYVSRTVIKADLEWLREKAEKYQVLLELIPFKGIQVQAKETNIRKLLISCFNLVVKGFNLETIDILCLILTELEIKKLKENILADEKGILKFIPDQHLIYFAICIGVTILRIRENYLVTEIDLVQNNKHETDFAQEILFKITGLNTQWLGKQAEIYFLAELLAGIPKINYPMEDRHKADWIFFQILTHRFIKAMQDYLQIAFVEDVNLFHGLLQHLYPAYIRMLNNQKIDNPIFEEVVKSYSLEFYSVKKHIYILEDSLKVKFNDEECGYLTLFFAASRKREGAMENTIPKVAVVCSAGISTSYLLTSQLANLFSVEIACISSIRKIKEDISKQKYDFILSTVDLEIGQDYLKVNPILSKEDIRVLACLFNGFRKKISIEPLIEKMKKYVLIRDEIALSEMLNEYLNGEKIKRQKGKEVMFFMPVYWPPC